MHLGVLVVGMHGVHTRACDGCYRGCVCGRFTYLFSWKQLHRLLGLATPALEYGPRYNVAPTQRAPVVRMRVIRAAESTGHASAGDAARGGIAKDGRETIGAIDTAAGGRRIDLLRWGLIPSWADDSSIGARLINARAETVADKPAFRSAFRKRRCIVPISGFYEWQAIAGSKAKQPYYIRPAGDDEVFGLAGLWERWEPRRTSGSNSPESESPGSEPTGSESPDTASLEPIETFTIITTDANEVMKPLHDRMPVILQPEDYAAWLDPDSPTERLQALLVPFPSEQMLAYPVSTRVNSPRNDSPACIAREDGQSGDEQPGLF